MESSLVQLDPATGTSYIHELRDRLMQLIGPQQTIEDVEARMRKLYPQSEVIMLALEEAHKSRNDSAFRTLKSRSHSSYSPGAFADTLHHLKTFAVAKVSNLVKSENEVDYKVEKFKLAFIDFILDEVLQLSESFVKRQTNYVIKRNDIRTAMHADKDLVDLFLSDDKSLLLTSNNSQFAQISFSDKANSHAELSKMTYNQKVKNMVDSKDKIIKNHLLFIIKVFKDQLSELTTFKTDVDNLFCNIEELYELSSQLMSNLEDALEHSSSQMMSSLEDPLESNGQDIPYVGSEIFELALAEEFHAYFTFTHKRLYGDTWKKSYETIINNIPKFRLEPSFELAVKHLLPNYLLNTIVQFFQYYRDINDLYELSKRHSNHHDQLALKETISILMRTKKAIECILEHEKYGLKQVETGSDALDPKKEESIKKELDRKFDAKLEQERNLPLPYMPPPEIYRFSEPDSKENIQFEESQNNNRTISSKQDLIKADDNTMTMNVTTNINNNNSPATSNTPTTTTTIPTNMDQIPVIRCATLIKLVERLTYHKYQPNIVDSFLTTYRSFISDPEELLELLVERYKIPDPPFHIVCPNYNGSQDDMPESDRAVYRQYLKRFRQEYTKPVKMRVINVIKSWVKNHYYDFERHPTLLSSLNSFLDEISNNDKVLIPLIRSIRNLIQQKSSQNNELEFTLYKPPPPSFLLSSKHNESEKIDILTLHPIEFARQLTLIEFEIFRAIKPSELIDVREIAFRSNRKEDKYETAPNLRRMTRHFTLISYWIRKCIVQATNPKERSAIYNKAIEIMGVLRELNNFTGLLIIGSAIESAPIMRLSQTRNTLSSNNKKILEDYGQLNENHMKKMQIELRHCNPPCLPYLGFYQTKLIQAKEGNRTFIGDNDDNNTPTSPTSPGPAKMINFTKQRIRASLVAEISNYQNQRYNFKVQPEIRQYLLSIEDKMNEFASKLANDKEQEISSTLSSSTSQFSIIGAKLNGSNFKRELDDVGASAITKLFDDYLFKTSEEIEPRQQNGKGIKASKSRGKLPDHLKSPGIKLKLQSN